MSTHDYQWALECWREMMAKYKAGRPSKALSASEAASPTCPTFSLAVTLRGQESDVQVDFQRDPKRWTEVRDAILVGIERLKGMIAEQNGCPAKPKLQEHWPVEIPLTNEHGEPVLVRAKERGGPNFLFTVQLVGRNPVTLSTTKNEARTISEAIRREIGRGDHP
jgi:hypothetical protein